MLSPNEFFAGSISDATGLSLVLLHTTGGGAMLVTQMQGVSFAMFLNGENHFRAFDCTGNTVWEGIVIPNVAIEVDQTSVMDPSKYDVPLGGLLREGVELSVWAKQDVGYSSIALTLAVALPQSASGKKAVFSRWQIVLGAGAYKRVLKPIDVTPKAAA